MKALLLAGLLASGFSGAAAALELSLPIDCRLGEDCFIQQYVDLDPGPGTQDYACGAATYDGHTGTDFRVTSLADVARGVPVLAAAPGRVKALRDSVIDRLVKSEADRAAVGNKECGNGVVITHRDGWETQYCHLRRGSISVQPGDRVESGDRVGLVGYSGNAAFPHVHLSVRKDGETVDPFRGLAKSASCGAGDAALWSPAALQRMPYQPTSLLGAGFAEAGVEMEQLETGSLDDITPLRESGALVSWGWAINLEKGDRIEVFLLGPAGEIASSAITLDNHKAQYLLFAGRKRPDGGWPAGDYRAGFTVLRSGRAVIEAERRTRIE